MSGGSADAKHSGKTGGEEPKASASSPAAGDPTPETGSYASSEAQEDFDDEDADSRGCRGSGALRAVHRFAVLEMYRRRDDA